jgi:transglutaminase-like putative cysteine protease
MRVFRILLAVFLLPAFVVAGDYGYPVSDIPEELMKDVNVVVREDVMTYKIASRSSAVLNVRFVATILNNKGSHYAVRAVYYSKLEKINFIRGAVYDADGDQIRKLRNNELKDQSVNDGVALYRDDRVKIADLSSTAYPYTIEFEYEQEIKYLYDIPDSWFSGRNTSTQRAVYSLIFPPELAPRYRLVNLEQEPVRQTLKDGMVSLTWSFENIGAVVREPDGPHPSELRPGMLAAPTGFEYEGYVGDMSSWSEFGKWFSLLNKGRDVLPAATKAKVAELTRGLTTDEEKARALYQYLQGKTRYVNISLGIGGLQPFPAEVVDQTGYGDCKALSNYMVALLKEAGVKAYYALVAAGDDVAPLIEDFPSHQSTNHVIVAIPGESDTLWLECTDQSQPFGYMGAFTSDRKALLITEDGGKLVNTVRYPDSLNVRVRNARVVMDASGNATATVRTSYAGLQYDAHGLSSVLNGRYDAQKEWALENTDIPSFNLQKFNFQERKDKLPEAVVSLDLELNHLASASGKRLFLVPNLMSRSGYLAERISERKTDLVIDQGFVQIDSIEYKIPEHLYPEYLPRPVQLKTAFGSYESICTAEEGRLLYVRRFTLRKGRYPAAKYNEYVEFRRAIGKADNTKLVLMNKT